MTSTNADLKALLKEQRATKMTTIGGTEIMGQMDYLASINPALISDEAPPNSIASVEGANSPAAAARSSKGELVVVDDNQAAGIIAVYEPPQSRLHVTDALTLAANVLRRNRACGGELSQRDYELLQEIADYATPLAADTTAKAVDNGEEAAAEAEVMAGLKPIEIQGL